MVRQISFSTFLVVIRDLEHFLEKMLLKVISIVIFLASLGFSQEENFVFKKLIRNDISKRNFGLEQIEKQWENLEFPSLKEFRRRKKPFTVNVEGIVGTGKSTFLRFFKPYRHIDVLPEPVYKWTNLNGTDLLQLIFDKPKRWAMAQESYVMLTMFEEHLRKFGVAKVMERSIHSARIVFIENLKRSGNVKDVEYAILSQWYDFLNDSPEFDLSTDLTVYLQTDPSVVVDRIKKRGRKEEAHVNMEFLTGIHKLHEDWLIYKNSTFPLPSQKVIVINTERPFDEMKEIYRSLAKKIIGIIPPELQYESTCSQNRI